MGTKLLEHGFLADTFHLMSASLGDTLDELPISPEELHRLFSHICRMKTQL
jgi:hypothetical protein